MDRARFDLTVDSEVRMARDAVRGALAIATRIPPQVQALLEDAASRLDRLALEAEAFCRESQSRRATARIHSVPAALRKLKSFSRRRR